MTTIVPYIVCTAHPDYKRPRVDIDFKQTTRESLESDLTEAYFNALVNELYYNHDTITQELLDMFFRDYYREHYMDNEPIDICYFMDGMWRTYGQPPIEVLSEIHKRWFADN